MVVTIVNAGNFSLFKAERFLVNDFTTTARLNQNLNFEL